MSETTLEFTVTIKAGEPVLHDIQDTLTGAKSDRPPLTGTLAVNIKQALIAGGIPDRFEVELHHGHIAIHGIGGGLSAREWLEADEISHHYGSSREISADDYLD